MVNRIKGRQDGGEGERVKGMEGKVEGEVKDREKRIDGKDTVEERRG